MTQPLWRWQGLHTTTTGHRSHFIKLSTNNSIKGNEKSIHFPCKHFKKRYIWSLSLGFPTNTFSNGILSQRSDINGDNLVSNHKHNLPYKVISDNFLYQSGQWHISVLLHFAHDGVLRQQPLIPSLQRVRWHGCLLSRACHVPGYYAIQWGYLIHIRHDYSKIVLEIELETQVSGNRGSFPMNQKAPICRCLMHEL